MLAFVDGRYTDFLPSHGGWSSIDGYDFGRFQTDATTDDVISASGPGDKYLGLWLVPQTGGGYSFSNIYKINWFLDQIKERYEAGEISGDKANYVNEHIGDFDFSLTEFTEAMNMSRSTMAEKMKSLTGMTPSSFVNDIRLRTAAALIGKSQGKIRVSDLAYEVGFNDPKYFSTLFKKKFGVSPGEYSGAGPSTSSGAVGGR